MDMVEVELSRIIINEHSEQQVIVLKEKGGRRAFPILIGIYEATAIDRGVKEYRTPRPLTHDLLCGILRGLDATVEKMIVTDLRKVMKLNRHHSLFKQGRLADSLAEHRELMAALEARKPERATRLMQAHFASGLEAAA